MKTKNKKTNKSAERQHHPYSPSSLQNLEVCPMYKSRSSTHVRTIAGTIAHGVAETGEDDYRLSDEDAAAAAECLDFVEQRRRLMQAQANAHCAEKGGNPNRYKVREGKESYLPIDDIEFPDKVTATTAGYVDHWLLAWDKKYAELIDWKFGRWPVEEAKNNLQGLAYALGLFKRIPTLEKIKFFFKQPLLNSLTEHEITRADIPEIYLRIQVVVARAREARAAGTFETARPMVPVCNFCDNIGKCPKVCDIALRVGHKFWPIEIPENITPTMILSCQDTSMALKVAQVVAVWADSFKKRLNDRVLRGEAPVPPGHALTSRQDREIADDGLFRSICESWLGPALFNQCCKPSFGAVEEKISERAERGQKKALVEQFGQELLDKGAVKLGQPYAFLRVVPEKKTNE